MAKGNERSKGDAAEVERLLDRVYETEDPDLVARVLELDPGNPEALLLQSDSAEDPEEQLRLLNEAMASTRERVEAGGELEDVRCGILIRTAATLCSLGRYQEALSSLEELRGREEPMLQPVVQALHYRALIGLEDWRRILSDALLEEEHGLGWAYGRLCAAFMLAGDDPGRRTAAHMFWEALSLDPDVPFYMLGYFPEPDEEDGEDAMESFNFASLYSDMCASRDLYRWFARGVLLFGLLSGRFEDDERDYAMELLESLGGRAEYDRMSDLIQASDDETVLETLAAHRCLAE